MARIKQTCTTKLVLEALRARDDFVTGQELVAQTGRATSQVWAALIHLLRSHCVGVEVQGNKRYWYALPPEDDQRLREHEEYALHTKRPQQRSRKRGS